MSGAALVESMLEEKAGKPRRVWLLTGQRKKSNFRNGMITGRKAGVFRPGIKDSTVPAGPLRA